MRKRSAYRQRSAMPPMLVRRTDTLEIRERMIIESFAGGWAGREEFDSLVDMRNVLAIAMAYKAEQGALDIAAAMRIAIGNIRDRHAETGRMGVTGDELALLREFCSVYRDFWMRQNVHLYAVCVAELERAIGDNGPNNSDDKSTTETLAHNLADTND